jgi:glycosyltransferase involved in cell wall biosynthesis
LLVLTDPLSGFFAISCKALQNLKLPFEESDPNQHLISQILAQNLTVREVAVTERPNIRARLDWDHSNKVVAALPAFNEERTLPKIIHAAKQYVDVVIVVDDGSTDATATVAGDAGAIVIQHNTNIGYGAALQTIFATARDIDAEALVILDADGQHNPDDIEKLLKPLLSGSDVVIGSRFLSKTKSRIPSYRKAGMKVLDTATAAAGVKNVTDTQSGFRAYNKKAIDAITINTSGMSAGSEILIQASDANLHITEVPITASYDPSTPSTHNPVSHGIEVLGRIIALISYRRPLPAFGIPGLILFVIGVAGSILAFFDYRITEHFPLSLSVMSAIFLFLGLALGITGLILNALIVIVRENRK